ncbi:MAG TPA: hypothetical protein PKH32_07300, partial [Verrucomicrobiota bacterium]|nr:hypothetical protein [Verrucomicrobiota bacterium]
AAPTALGSIETVVVEDSTFDVNYMGNQIDANYGGHFVFRYNYVTNSQVQAHAVQGNNRGSRKWEVYGNTFVGNNSSWAWTPMFLRAGTGVIWSNRIVGHYTQPRIVFDVRRGAEGPKGAGGKADGSSQWDGNTTNGIPGATGTHTGSTSATTLVDSTKNWTPGMFELKRTVNGVTHNYNRWIYNVTDGSRAQIVANTATTITVAALKGGKDNRWENGDRYFITGGYPARDQIGAGQDQYLWTTYWEGTAPPQAIEPVYIWGNEGFEGVVVSNGEQCKFLIQEGRDYILGQPKPGYKPLAYPHPLRTDAPSTGVVPPRNLKIVTAQN